MRLSRYPAATAMSAAILLSGCEVSPVFLQPIYEKRDLVRDPNLVGAWADEDSENGKVEFVIIEFEDGYLLTDPNHPEDDLLVHLVEFSGLRFLNVSNRTVGLGDIRGHFIASLRFLDGDRLEMAGFREERLKERAGFLELAHLRVRAREEILVITAGPSDLQAFLARTYSDPELYDTVSKYRRVRDEAAPDEGGPRDRRQ